MSTDVRDIEAKLWDPIKWEKGTMLASLSQLRARVEEQAVEAIGWYYAKKKPKNFWSRWLRFAAIALTVLGGLVPIVAATGIVEAALWQLYGLKDSAQIKLAEMHFNQFGYVLIGLAAGCVAFDRFFGFSTNWMRYIGAAMRIETARVGFRFKWEHLVASLEGTEPGKQEVGELLEAIEDFSLAIREAIEHETGAWISEFQTNLSQLDKETKALFEGAQREKKATEERARARKAKAQGATA